MRASVRAAFVGYSTPLEGLLNFQYLDELGLVTTAMGDLIDPMSLALTLEWVNKKTGAVASKQTVINEWLRVKAAQSLRKLGGGAFAQLTTLKLTDASIDMVIDQRLDLNDSMLTRSFPGYVDWPSDGQLGLLGMAWSMGPAFRPKFPKFAAACDALDFDTASIECKEDETGNPGLVARNRDQAILFKNAAVVIQQGLDRDTLFWPRVLMLASSRPPF